MKQQKILVFEAYPVFSGAQRVSLNFCKALKAENKHITLLLADDAKNSISDNFRDYVDEIKILKTHRSLLKYGNSDNWFNPLNFVKSFIVGLLPFYFQCISFLKKGKFDVLYFCDPRGAVMILIPSIFFSMKKIMYLQSKNKLNPTLSKYLFLTFTDFVVCPSNDVLKSLPDSDRKRVINYGIDFSQYKNISKEKVALEIQQLILPEDSDRPKLLFAGLIKPQKGVHHLIYALKELSEKISSDKMPIVFIVGVTKTEAEDNYKSELIAYSKKYNIDKYIYWMGWRDDVLSWMKNSNYFIFPTINRETCTFPGFDKVIESTEGSPVVLIESSLCETFTIAARVTGVTDTITEGVNGLTYNPDNLNELPLLLERLITEKPKFQGFPNREYFSPKTFSEKFLALIDN